MMEELRGLSTVRVSKEFLLKKLRENRETHKKTYDKAMEAWHEKVLKVMETELEKVKKDKTYPPNVFITIPYSYVDSYDNVIALLKASLDDEFILSTDEFAKYVLDKWSWKTNFNTTISDCYSGVQ